MLDRLDAENPLMAIVEKMGKRAKKANIVKDISTINFPRLTEEYIKAVSFGIYQRKQARSYVEEFIDEDGNYQYELFKELDDVLRVKLKSRFGSNTIHNTYIQFDNTSNNIASWYCDCKSGARTVGACSHVISVMWFFGVIRGDISKLSLKSSSNYIDFCYDCRDKYDLNDESAGYNDTDEQDEEEEDDENDDE